MRGDWAYLGSAVPESRKTQATSSLMPAPFLFATRDQQVHGGTGFAYLQKMVTDIF